MTVRVSFLLLVAAVVVFGHAKGERSVPDLFSIKPAHGQPWPMPQSMNTFTNRLAVHPESFHFLYNETSGRCDLLINAFARYYKLIFYPQTYWDDLLEQSSSKKKIFKQNFSKKVSNLGDTILLERLNVNIQQACDQWPSFESNESYTLNIQGDHGVLDAVSVWGALRGLETFSQLIYSDDDLLLAINETTINDFPRFQHRGLLFDTSTHFVSVNTIKINLEAMAQSKLNVFHFHIVDDQSFPYTSRTYPEMSEKGAYDELHIYSQEDIADLIEFARQRGIRVFVEFDTPSHTKSWSKSIDLLTKCYDGEKPNNHYGPMDPSRNTTFDFLNKFFREIADVFPDHYIHLGGDEVNFKCWENNPNVTQFMHQMGFGTNYSLLEQYYMQRLIDIVNNTGKGYAIWQEVIDNNVTVKADTIVQIWKEPQGNEIARVTQLGYRTLLSTCWYLNLISYGPDWIKYYQCEPYNFTGTEEQKKLVIGGEICMWGEFVDNTNIISTTWPRAAAAAERLWSSIDVNDPVAAAPRLDEHRCRYLRRGIPAAPVNGPSFCPIEYRG